jgi:hypothetical protein
VKRDCLILLIAMSLITMSAPQGLSRGMQAADGFSEGTKGALQTEGAQNRKAQRQADKSTSSRAPTKEERKAAQIKSKLHSLGIASRVTVILNNGNERYGSIERLDDDTFQLAEVDLKQVFTVAYHEVKKVREGYGNPNQFTGKRWNPIWAKISLAAVVVMFLVVLPLAVPRT